MSQDYSYNYSRCTCAKIPSLATREIAKKKSAINPGEVSLWMKQRDRHDRNTRFASNSSTLFLA